MRLTRPRTRKSLAPLAVAFAALTVSACGSSGPEAGPSSTTAETAAKVDAPGVTDTEIRFSSFGTDSNNPTGTCVLRCYDSGIKAYFAYRNSEGGIYGRKLVLTHEIDDQLGKNLEAALEIVSKNDTFAVFGTSPLASGWATIAKAGMPFYVQNISPESAGRDGIFGNVGAICFTCTRRMTVYVAGVANATHIATIGYGIAPSSKACTRQVKASFEKYGGDVGGAEVVYLNDSLQFGTPNGVGPEVTAMKKAGVDLVVTCIDMNGAKTFALEMRRQGMEDVPMYHPSLYDAEFVRAADDALEGDFVSPSFRPFEAAAGGTALETFRTWMRRTDAPITEAAMYGWINADEAFTGLRAAGPSFSRRAVIAETNKITRYTADGLIPPLDFGRQHEAPTEDDPVTHGPNPECSPLLKIHDGKFQLVGPKDKPFACWPGTTRKWSTPIFRSFR